MRTLRRAALTAVALLSTIGLTACGGSGSSTASDSPSTPAADVMSDMPEVQVSGEITVFAAASLQKSYEEIGAAFEEAHPDASVTFDFQGSQDLVSALAQGSAADVLATADTTTMGDAAGQGLVGEQQEFATNRLAIIVPEGNPAGITGFDESLNADGVDLVICNDQAPCGKATVKMEEATGVTLNPVSEEAKVSDVRGKVESGEADAGIVYTTDAAIAKGTETIEIPDLGVVNHYPIATTTSSANPDAAQAFVDFVLSEKGQSILQDTYGFGAPDGATPGATTEPSQSTAAPTGATAPGAGGGASAPATGGQEPASTGEPTEESGK